MNQLNTTAALFLILLSSNTGYAAQRIATLDFELNDITSLPNTPTELKRTASMAPLLVKALSQAGGYEIVPIDASAQKSANAGFGYLFRFHDVAAQLGQKFGAEWIVVGQHSKPSFLYSYLIVQVINVGTQSLVAEIDIELKGNHTKVTERALQRLSRDIIDTISR